jgi:hypothetical protein
MTMIEERALRAALRAAAESISVPEHGADQILTAAQLLDARPRAGFGLRARSGTSRDASGAQDEHRTDSDPGEARQRRRPSRRVLGLAAAVTAVLGIALGAFATLGGAPSSNLAAPNTRRIAAGRAPSATPAPNVHSSGSGGIEYGPLAGTATVSPPSTPTLPTGAVGQSSDVEETGEVDLTVGQGQLEPVLTRLSNLATAQGGFVASTQVQAGGASASPPSSGSITLQVPEASFGSVVAQARTFGRVTFLTTKGTDVTGQYVDLQARIAALTASREQYLTIMTKASSISDILAVQAQLDTLQTQIEQLQGQLQVLNSETTYGTLVVSLSEHGGHPVPVHHRPSGIDRAWHGALSGFAAAFDGLIRIAGPALFVLLCLAVLAVLGRWAWRETRRRTL